jgi:hypothetical protein
MIEKEVSVLSTMKGKLSDGVSNLGESISSVRESATGGAIKAKDVTVDAAGKTIDKLSEGLDVIGGKAGFNAVLENIDFQNQFNDAVAEKLSECLGEIEKLKNRIEELEK